MKDDEMEDFSKAIVIYDQMVGYKQAAQQHFEAFSMMERALQSQETNGEDQIQDNASSRYNMISKVNYDGAGQGIVTLYEVPIKESTLIRDLDRLVAH